MSIGDHATNGDAPANGANGHAAGQGLDGYLKAKREEFLRDLKAGSAKDWTVVMGNEAGDLDSIASSIAFSVLFNTLAQQKSVPLVLTPSKYMHLRPENDYAFDLAKVSKSSLLHPDTITYPSSTAASSQSLQQLTALGVQYALVDTNRLLPEFGEGHVNAIVDHHDDEHVHTDAAIRMIQVPTGSCASLVVKQFRTLWEQALTNDPAVIPPEVASLLLMAILIDTGGLKKGGKATETDYDSAAFLYPKSTFSDDTIAGFSVDDSAPAPLTAVFKELAGRKFNVSHLSTTDLLLRDYKEYSLPTASDRFPVLKAGLSTVPFGLKPWLGREEQGWTTLLRDTEAYMVERNLDIEGILTSFQSDKGKHKREIVLVVRSSGSIPTPEDAQRVLEELRVGFEADTVLELGPWKAKGIAGWIKEKKRRQAEQEGRYFAVWKQGNAKATRKQVAPTLRELVGKLI